MASRGIGFEGGGRHSSLTELLVDGETRGSSREKKCSGIDLMAWFPGRQACLPSGSFSSFAAIHIIHIACEITLVSLISALAPRGETPRLL